MTSSMTVPRHVLERDWLALVAGDLTPARLAAVAAHASDCPACARQLETCLRLDGALATLTAERGEAGSAAWRRSIAVESPIGPLLVTASERGICRVEFAGTAETSPDADRDPVLGAAREQIAEYFAGKRTRFDLPIDLTALGPFQREVLEQTGCIGFGAVATYGSLARTLGRPRAARAVGGALNRNPVPILIPCHRVVGASGSLVGYAGGLDAKRYLLTLEGALKAA